MKHDHYKKPVAGLQFIDVYRVLSLFGVTDPCIQHAIKKLLVAGGRGHKDIEHDVQDTIDTLIRWQEMRGEDDRLEGDRVEDVVLSKIVNVNVQIGGDPRAILPALQSAMKMPDFKPPKPEPASQIDDESDRAQAIAQNGNTGDHYGFCTGCGAKPGEMHSAHCVFMKGL